MWHVIHLTKMKKKIKQNNYTRSKREISKKKKFGLARPRPARPKVPPASAVSSFFLPSQPNQKKQNPNSKSPFLPFGHSKTNKINTPKPDPRDPVETHGVADQRSFFFLSLHGQRRFFFLSPRPSLLLFFIHTHRNKPQSAKLEKIKPKLQIPSSSIRP